MTKDELLDAVWPATAVSDAVVRVAVGTLRKALDDTAQTPRYIATVARRGYRFLAPVTVLVPAAVSPALPSAPLPLLVEREAVLAQLHIHLAQAVAGDARPYRPGDRHAARPGSCPHGQQGAHGP